MSIVTSNSGVQGPAWGWAWIGLAYDRFSDYQELAFQCRYLGLINFKMNEEEIVLRHLFLALNKRLSMLDSGGQKNLIDKIFFVLHTSPQYVAGHKRTVYLVNQYLHGVDAMFQCADWVVFSNLLEFGKNR